LFYLKIAASHENYFVTFVGDLLGMKERLRAFLGESRLLPDERIMVFSRVMSASEESSLSFSSNLALASASASAFSAANSKRSLSREESMVWLKIGSFRFSFSSGSILIN
jgi:hypothetical protein